MLGTFLFDSEEELVVMLRKNIYLFSSAPSDMPRIDTRVVCHRFTIEPTIKHLSQIKHNVGEEKRELIDEEVLKLTSANFVKELKYPSWLASMVLVKKASNKWRLYVNFIDLDTTCPKDLYLLPNIDCMVDGPSSYKNA